VAPGGGGVGYERSGRDHRRSVRPEQNILRGDRRMRGVSLE
jgi:hypothetical protein